MDKESRTAYFLADLTGQIVFADLPGPVVEKAKWLIADSMACMIGGTLPVQGEKIIGIFNAMAGVPEIPVFGTPNRMPLLNAVYVNSYLATTLDMDDTYDGHPGSTIVPVALSMGGLENISGRKLIEAVVTGYEIGIRIANGIKPTPERTKRVRGINTWQVFCAAAVAAKLQGLDREGVAHAYGHAALHASVPSLRKWGFMDGRIQWLKNNFGYTSYGGVLSSILAREGFIADTTIFDGQDGFWIMASSDRCDYAAIRTPPDHYFTLKVHTKPYPACRHIHPTLDALTAVVRENRPQPERIQSILVETFYEVVDHYTCLPTLPFDVVFSAPYLAALALHGIEPGPEWLKPERISDRDLLATAKKVVFSEWEEASRRYPEVDRELMSKVTVTEKNGRCYQKTVRIPMGDPRNPMGPNEMAAKFDALAGPVIGRAKADLLFRKVVEELETVDSIGELIALMIP